MDYIFIDKTIKTSIYKQISSSISEAIECGRLKYNDRLPTEKEICDVFDVSQTAVKMAYQQLIQQHMIKRVKGRGTFVTNRKTYHQAFSNIYLFETHPDQKSIYQTTDLLFDCMDDAYIIQRMLKLERESSYYVIQRVVKENNQPIVYQHIYLPEQFYPELKKKYRKSMGIFHLINDVYGLSIAQIQNTFSPIKASSAEAQLLNILPNEAVYLVRSQWIDQQQRIVSYIVNYFPGEFTQFEVTVHARS
jgi:GntR family transcriptional regulator